MPLSKEQLDKANAARAADPAIGRRKLVKLLRCSDYAAAKFLSGEALSPKSAEGFFCAIHGQRGPETENKAGKLGVPVRKFLERFDFEAKLEKTVKALCADRFVSDADIRAESGIPAGSFRDVAGLPQFQKLQIKDGGTLWWSTEENVEAVRAAARKWRITK